MAPTTERRASIKRVLFLMMESWHNARALALVYCMLCMMDYNSHDGHTRLAPHRTRVSVYFQSGMVVIWINKRPVLWLWCRLQIPRTKMSCAVRKVDWIWCNGSKRKRWHVDTLIHIINNQSLLFGGKFAATATTHDLWVVRTSSTSFLLSYFFNCSANPLMLLSVWTKATLLSPCACDFNSTK